MKNTKKCIGEKPFHNVYIYQAITLYTLHTNLIINYTLIKLRRKE